MRTPWTTNSNSLGMLGMFGMLAMAMASAACFIETAEPSTFRYQCGSNSECDPGLECANGLCQQPCGAEGDLDCPQSAPICINSYCASVCPLNEDVCPSPQACVSLSAPDEEPAESGVCSVPCGGSSGAPCAEGMFCYEEILCVQLCPIGDECGSGEQCLGGFCVPASSDGGGAP